MLQHSLAEYANPTPPTKKKPADFHRVRAAPPARRAAPGGCPPPPPATSARGARRPNAPPQYQTLLRKGRFKKRVGSAKKPLRDATNRGRGSPACSSASRRSCTTCRRSALQVKRADLMMSKSLD